MGVSSSTYRRVAIFALVALCLIVVTGAAVRLTGSGLGCSDWPTCEEDKFVAPLELEPMVEWVNRMITGLVSLAVIFAVLGSLVRRPRRHDLTRWSLALVAGVFAQIIIGAVVTLSDLKYSVVALHFLVSMGLVWAATVLVELAGRPDGPDGTPPAPRPWSTHARWSVGLAMAILVTGPVVTSAGPHAGDPDVDRLPVDIGWSVRVHSIVVWVFLGSVVLWTIAAHRRGDRVEFRRLSDLLVAAVVQGGIGYAQYFADVPALLVGLHVAGATLVWVLTVRAALASGVVLALDLDAPDRPATNRSVLQPGAPAPTGASHNAGGSP